MGVLQVAKDIRARLIPRSRIVKYIISPTLLALFFSTTYLWYYFFIADYAPISEAWEVIPESALATRLRPNELLSRPLASGGDIHSIPSYIHQSWRTDELPSTMTKWSQTCRAHHRHWNWLLWTNEDNLKMVETYFPWFLDTYRALPAEINRADASRNMYMYLFGGFYADLDVECLRPLDDLFHHHGISVVDLQSRNGAEQQTFDNEGSHVAFFGMMPWNGDWAKYHVIPNAWMASSPGHPFFLHILERLRVSVEAHRKNQYRLTAEELTGPVALYHGIESYNSLLDNGTVFETYFDANPSYHLFNRTLLNLRMEILPTENIFPYSWNRAGKPYRKYCFPYSSRFNSTKCKEVVTTNQTYTITYWSHIWNQNLHKTYDMRKMSALKGPGSEA